MPHSIDNRSRWIGVNIQGDIGPLTLYTSKRGKLVVFERAPPLHPPTVTQEYFRDRFRNAAAQWRSASQQTRNEWRAAAAAANLGITGFDLWNWYHRTRDRDRIATIEHIYGKTLTKPTIWP